MIIVSNSVVARIWTLLFRSVKECHRVVQRHCWKTGNSTASLAFKRVGGVATNAMNEIDSGVQQTHSIYLIRAQP